MFLNYSKSVQGKFDLVVFQISAKEYAVPITNVHSITTPDILENYENRNEFIKGIINSSGCIIPVINSQKKFNSKKLNSHTSTQTKIIIIEVQGHTVGLIIDKAPKFLSLKFDNIFIFPQVPKNKGFLAIGKIEERQIILVNTDNFFTNKEENEIKNIYKIINYKSQFKSAV